MAQLTALPAELLHHIFAFLDPRDLGAGVPRVCRAFNDYIKGNWKLFQDVYLNHLDKPRHGNMDWEQALHDFVRLQLICDRPVASAKDHELEFVHKTVTDLLDRASSRGYTNDNSNTHSASRNADLLRQLFSDRDSTCAAFLERSFLFERVRCERPLTFPPPRGPADDAHQRSAHLHCLYGSPIQNVGRLRSTRTYPFACSSVYDMRGHTARTGWGPFRDDGSGHVDWQKVEAVMVVLGYNIQSKRFVSKLFSDVWNTPFSGSWPASFMQTPPLSPPRELSSLELSDPYGITGTWYRVVCFLDYNDFFTYNFPMGDPFPDNLPRPGISVGEATRLIILKLHVTRIEPPGPDDGQELPVVHFTGDSRLLDDGLDANASSELKGTVRLTVEGEVRWTSSSLYNGQERWKSEGIQIGGVRSARGVMGFWFDSDYDAHGPVGPTAIWKASDSEAPYGKIADILPTGFLAYSALVSVEDSDPESEMDYSADEEEEEEELEIDFEMLRGELPALLLDANMDVVDVPHDET
ncbi:F-box domain-containing [Cordyceps militaris]|uniref:F-box domain-containing n=1 Tax=Cordyceps militaris TaxID=73501 RepID=A0A2H4SB84_CORMI|nr:F-box domain-containing [Cordyceps militaris]